MSVTMSDPAIDREEILAHLDCVLADRRFAAAERNARFLRYVVESTLEGRGSEVKESVIAIEVYGRSADYDPKADSIVRVEATRLRQKLQSYYENEGRHSPIRLLLPKGGYVPQFERAREPVSPPEMPAEAEILSPKPRRPQPRTLPVILVLAAMGTSALWWNSRKTPAPPPDRAAQEALAAWQEGVALLNLDPHSALTEGGPPKTLLRAVERLEFSVARDSSRAQAWAALAEAYDYASGFAGRDLDEDTRRIEAAANRAVALDNRLAAGHHMLGLLYKGIKWEFGKAEAAYRRALALDPANASAAVEYADLLWETGRAEAAAAEIRKARALLPASPALAAKEAELQVHLGRPDAAIVTASEAIQSKRTYLRAHIILGLAHEAKGNDREALACYEHVLRSNPSDRRALPAYGYLLARTGDKRRAREVALRLEQLNLTVRNLSFQLAVVYTGLGEDAVALNWLERAWRTRQAHFPFAAAEYRFRRFHQNERFRELLSRVGLKPV